MMDLQQLAASVPYPDDYIDATLLARRLHIGMRSVWRFVRNGLLPQPIRLGRKATRWRWRDVVLHLQGHPQPHQHQLPQEHQLPQKEKAVTASTPRPSASTHPAARKGIGQGCREDVAPPRPTSAPPRSPGKLAALEARALAGDSLWHPLDTPFDLS